MNQRGSLWPDISNPIARRVVVAAFRRIPLETKYSYFGRALLKDNLDQDLRINSNIIPGDLRAYRDRLRQTLTSSGIAQNLLDQWYHDDFYDALPASVAWWYKMFRPRGIQSLTIHVSKHLGWYLDRTKSYPLRELLIPPLLALGGIVGGVFLTLLALIPGAPTILIIMLLIGALVYGNSLRANAASRTSHTNLASTINSAEFYLYLREAYRDVD